MTKVLSETCGVYYHFSGSQPECHCAERICSRKRHQIGLARDRFRGLVRSPVETKIVPSLSASPGPPHPMPFVRYLSHDGREVSQDDGDKFDPNFPTHLTQPTEHGNQGSSPHVHSESPPLQLQLPYFMSFGSSTVAPGGGAEVLPFSQVPPTGEPSPAWTSSSFFPFSTGDQ